jgi:Co/Zn/Cd efflux system component
MQRLFIVLPVYAFVAIFLPQRPEVRELMEPLLRVDATIALYIAVAALGSSGLGLWLFRREPNGLLFRKNTWAMRIAFMGLIGIFFAAVFHVFERMSGQYSSLMSLILLPIAFMAAEAVFEFIQSRRRAD